VCKAHSPIGYLTTQILSPTLNCVPLRGTIGSRCDSFAIEPEGEGICFSSDGIVSGSMARGFKFIFFI